jgi:indolepyruvate ferredoxin oxidoreductase, beta subunit
MMTKRPLSVLIGALGGQGGGVLTNWLVAAAQSAGYPAQATSIPGVAQRTGATTYYFELFPEQNPAADPVFCLSPAAGDVDLVVALEPTEAGRALAHGYVSEQTAVITSIARIYSTAEKAVAGDGIVPLELLLQNLAQVGERLITIDPAVTPGVPDNAQILGAIIGSGVLPIPAAAARAAIEAQGLAVQANLAAFEAGLHAAGQDRAHSIGATVNAGATTIAYNPPPPALAGALDDFPAEIRPLLGHALDRLVDYQNEAYARCYLARLRQVLAADRQAGGAERDFLLTAEVARPLAAWMSYEDVARVAQLKTRPGRLARIRAEMGAQPGEPVVITDFLTPGPDQLSNVLPARLARLFAPGESRQGVGVAWPTSSLMGYGMLKLLAALRRLRPYSQTFAGEQAAIDAWLEATVQAAVVDYDLACQTARLAVWVRGYGDIRARGLHCLETLFTDWEKRLHSKPDAVKTEVAHLLRAARNNPDAPCRQ